MQRACADHLRDAGLPPDLVGRIGAFAAFGDLEGDDDARQGIAESAIVALAAEYGLVLGTVDPVVIEVVEDIAEASGDEAGARALQHAARELLAECFAELAGRWAAAARDDRGGAAARRQGQRSCTPTRLTELGMQDRRQAEACRRRTTLTLALPPPPHHTARPRFAA